MNERDLRAYYKALSFKFLIVCTILAIIVIFSMVKNNSWFQFFCLVVSLAALLISIGLNLQYFVLLKDPLSSIGENSFPKNLNNNRKMVYSNNVFFYVGLIFILIACIAHWLLPKNTNTNCSKIVVHDNKGRSFDTSGFYKAALHYASIPTEEKICKNLVAINSNTLKNLEPDTVNKVTYITVYTIKDNDYYTGHTDTNHFYKTDRYIWVFTKKNFFDKYSVHSNEDSVYRLKQLMGFSPDFNAKKVVSFSVNPKDLFRPCLDTAVNDCACEAHLNLTSMNIHQKFVVDYQIDNYTKYPFTRLGYTFDWNEYNFSHVGTSEFVINPLKEIKIDTVMDVKDFLRNGMKEYK